MYTNGKEALNMIMKKTILLFYTLLLFTFVFAGGATAADYPGYYISFGYDKDGSGKPVNNADGFPAKYIANFQFHEDGTYEGLLFGALVKGRWHKMTNQSGNEFLGLRIDETVDKKLEEKYGLGSPAFVFRYYAKADVYVLGQLEADEMIYMDKKSGKLDVDKVINEIQEYLSGEQP